MYCAVYEGLQLQSALALLRSLNLMLVVRGAPPQAACHYTYGASWLLSEAGGAKASWVELVAWGSSWYKQHPAVKKHATRDSSVPHHHQHCGCMMTQTNSMWVLFRLAACSRCSAAAEVAVHVFALR